MKELDWANLPFGYMKTDYNVRIYYRNEQWGALEVCSSRRRAAAGSHADSQDQSSNGNTNILEFHIKNLLTFEKTVSRKAVQVKPFRKKIF